MLSIDSTANTAITGTRAHLAQFLTLLGLTSLASTEPALSAFGNSPGLFIFHGVDSPALAIAYSLCVALLPATLLALACAIVSLVHARAGQLVYYALVAALVFTWVVQQLRWTWNVDHTALIVLPALVLAALFLRKFATSATLRSWCRALALAPLILVPLFVYQLYAYGVFLGASAAEPVRQDAGSEAPSVVFVILDELPTWVLLDANSELDARAYPNLGLLANTATWYRNYSVMASQTYNSVPSIVTGLNPRNASPTTRHFPNNLFSLLAPTHHRVALESITRLCPAKECSAKQHDAPGGEFSELLTKTFAFWIKRASLDERAQVTRNDFAETLEKTEAPPSSHKPTLQEMFDPAYQVELAKSRPRRLARFIDSLGQDPSPTLYFLHLQLPHSPWRFYPDGALYSVPTGRFAISSYNTHEWPTTIAEYRLVLQMQYTDRLLGELFNRLKQAKLWDNALVVITSDHGRSFVKDTGTRSIAEAFAHVGFVPLLIKAPGQREGEVDDSNLQAVDVLPTVASILDVPLDWPTDGLPAGHADLALRNSTKTVFPIDTTGKTLPLKLLPATTLRDNAAFPDASTRRLPSNLREGAPVEKLNAKLGIESYVGKPVSALNATNGGSATIDEIEHLREPPPHLPRPGLVMGTVDDAREDDTLLLAINGQVITGSPVFTLNDTPNTFMAMLPQGLLQARNKVALFRLRGDALTRLSLR